jgi:hypothetical protein
MTPDPFPALLEGYYGCENRTGIRWANELTEKVIDLAKPIDCTGGGWETRAYCPLCGHGSSSPFSDGYSLPEGLRRHLDGLGNTSKCEVMKVAGALARAHFNDKFAAGEAAEEKAKQDLGVHLISVQKMTLRPLRFSGVDARKSLLLHEFLLPLARRCEARQRRVNFSRWPLFCLRFVTAAAAPHSARLGSGRRPAG